MKLLKKYKNGNYTVQLYDDGTKIRILDDGEVEYKPNFPENVDCCISKKCGVGCAFCYENCTPEGKEFDYTYYKNKEFLDSLIPGMEMAIGGGALSEVDPHNFRSLMMKLHFKGVFPSITINAKELLKEEFVERFLNKIFVDAYIYGIGISYNASEECKEAMLKMKRKFPKRVVIHTILGVTRPEDYQWLADNHFKVLVLGYKMKGRGLTYFSKKDESNKDWAIENLLNLRDKFKTLSFDCLAVKQMD